MASRWQLAILVGAGLGMLVTLQAYSAGRGTCPVSMGQDAKPATVVKDQNHDHAATEAKRMAELIENDGDFESKVLQADRPVLVDFYADWCGPCKFLAPIVEELATELDGKAHVYKVDVDKMQSVAAKYGIQSIPTVIVFNNGEAASSFVGVRGKEEYLAAVTKAIGG